MYSFKFSVHTQDLHKKFNLRKANFTGIESDYSGIDIATYIEITTIITGYNYIVVSGSDVAKS